MAALGKEGIGGLFAILSFIHYILALRPLGVGAPVPVRSLHMPKGAPAHTSPTQNNAKNTTKSCVLVPLIKKGVAAGMKNFLSQCASGIANVLLMLLISCSRPSLYWLCLSD